MSRFIEITCSLKDANDVISEILGNGKSTEDLLITIPIEVEDRPKHYHSLCHDPRIKEWNFALKSSDDSNYSYDQEKETDSKLLEKEISEVLKEEKSPKKEVEEELLLSPRGKDIYKFLWSFLSVYQHSPEVLPSTKLWKRLYLNSLTSMSASQINDKILKECDKIVEIGYTFICENIETISTMIWKYLKSLPETMGKGEKFEKLVNYLLNDVVNGPRSCTTN